jgi:hypothetical protein
VPPFFRSLAFAASAAALAASAAASAQDAGASDPSSIRRLSPEQKARILADNEARAADAAVEAAIGRDSPGSGVHGELGAVIGSGGTAGIFGTALVPLGDRGAAIFSFENFRSDTRQRPRR